VFLSFLLLITFTAYSSEPEIPNKKEFEEIALMTAMASADGDADMAKIISERALNKQDMCGDPDKKVAGPFLKDVKFITPPAIEVKKSPKVTFYSRFIAPVEEMKFYDVTNSGDNLPDLEKVVKAQGDKERNEAINKLCEGKSNLEKIKYASTLHEKLSVVYNDGMYSAEVGSGSDPYSDIDPTKKPHEKFKITLQRQYNALNREFFDGNRDWPPQAGVCAHASVLVSDFLNQCGLKASPVAYATSSKVHHAVVRAVDPKTKKTYFLNWGELKEAERAEALSNFDIPAEGGLKNYGMIIRHFTPDGKAVKANSRSNTGVVMARLLHISDDQVDVTTYGTNETGAVIELRNFKKLDPKSGVIKEVHEELILSAIEAQGPEKVERLDFTNIFRDTIKGISATYKSEGGKYAPNNTYEKEFFQGSLGLFEEKNTMKSFWGNTELSPSSIQNSSGVGLSLVGGKSVGKMFGDDNHKTQIEAGGKIVGEGYLLKNGSYNKTQNLDGNIFVVTEFKVKNESKKNYVELDSSAKIAPGVSVDSRGPLKEYSKITAQVHDPKINLVFAEKISNKQTVGVNASYVGSFDRESTTLEAFYENHKHKTSASGGFVVVKSDDGRSDVYALLKTGKDVKWGSGDIKTNIEARKAVTNSNPAAIQATVSIKK